MRGYILWFSYAFKVCSKSVSEIRYIRPVIVVRAVMTHKMFDTWTKHLSATDGLLKGPCGWRNSIFKPPLSTFTSALCQIADTAEIRKTRHVFISTSLVNDLSKSNWRNSLQFCCKILEQNGGYSLFRHGLWLCKAILQASMNIDHFFLTYTKKIWWKEFFLHINQALIGRSKFGHVGVFVNCVSQRLTNLPTPSHGDLPWLVAKNIHSASILESCWWWHKLMLLQFLYCSVQPSEN